MKETLILDVYVLLTMTDLISKLIRTPYLYIYVLYV